MQNKSFVIGGRENANNNLDIPDIISYNIENNQAPASIFGGLIINNQNCKLYY